MNVLGLMQLCQTSQPFYSYSLGLDAAVRRHDLRSDDALADLVTGVLRGAIGPAEGVASGVAFRAARAGEAGRIPGLCSLLNSEKVPADLRLASMQMGSRLWEVSRRWDWTGGIHEQYDRFLGSPETPHAVAFGTLISETTNSALRAVAAYLFNIARSLIQAAVRAIPLEEAAGNRVLAAMHPTISELAATCAEKNERDIVPVSPPNWSGA